MSFILSALCVFFLAFLSVDAQPFVPATPFNLTYWYDYRTFASNPSQYTGSLPGILTWSPSVPEGDGVSIVTYWLNLQDPNGFDSQTPLLSGASTSYYSLFDPRSGQQGNYSASIVATDSNNVDSDTFYTSFLTYSGSPSSTGFTLSLAVSNINGDLWTGSLSWVDMSDSATLDTNGFPGASWFTLQLYELPDDFSPSTLDVSLWNVSQPATLTVRAQGIYLIIVQGFADSSLTVPVNTLGYEVNLDLIATF
jgi:hypothetical protein